MTVQKLVVGGVIGALALGLAGLTGPASSAVPQDRTAATAGSTAEARAALAHAERVVGGSAAVTGREATLALRDLWQRRDQLTGADRAAADRLLARPTDGPSDPEGFGYPNNATVETLCSTTFCLHWVEESAHAVSTVDADTNGFPDYVDQAMDSVELASGTFAAAGYRSPKPDGTLGGDARTDVYLANTMDDGIYGYCTTDEEIVADQFDYWAFCVVDSHLSVPELQVTVAHEYFHAVQFAYDAGEDPWFMEGTATWMEDELYDDVDDNLQYLPASPLVHPEIPLDLESGLRWYGTWIYFRYLTERWTAQDGGLPTIIRDLWERADSTQGAAEDYFSMQAINAVLQQRGADPARVFAEFVESTRRPRKVYDEAVENSYPHSSLAGKLTLRPADRGTTIPRAATLDHLSGITTRLVPSAKLTATAWKLRLEADLPSRSRGAVSLVRIYRRDGSAATKHVSLDASGDGSLTVPFSVRRTKYVEWVVANASARFTCWQDVNSPYSCYGTPLDDGLENRFSVTLLR